MKQIDKEIKLVISAQSHLASHPTAPQPTGELAVHRVVFCPPLFFLLLIICSFLFIILFLCVSHTELSCVQNSTSHLPFYFCLAPCRSYITVPRQAQTPQNCRPTRSATRTHTHTQARTLMPDV